MTTEARDWADVRAAVIAAIGDVGALFDRDDEIAGHAEQIADAVLAVCDEEAVNRMADTFVEESRFRSLQVRNGRVELEAQPAREIAAMWAGAARTLLKGAENYAEIEMEFSLAEAGPRSGRERYAFTVQRVGKLTPHQARRAAEAERDELRARLAALTGKETADGN